MKNVLKLLGLIAMVAVMGLVMVGCGNNCVGDGNCGGSITVPASLDLTDYDAVDAWFESVESQFDAIDARQCANAECRLHVDATGFAWMFGLFEGQRANLNVSCNC